MGLSILAVVKRLLCRIECEKWKCRQRKYTRKIIKITTENVSHTHTKRNKGSTGIDACKRDQRWARWFWLSTLIPFWNLFYYTIYLFTFIDGRKSTCQQAFSLSLPISPLICYTFVYTLRNSWRLDRSPTARTKTVTTNTHTPRRPFILPPPRASSLKTFLHFYGREKCITWEYPADLSLHVLFAVYWFVIYLWTVHSASLVRSIGAGRLAEV
jgi:hypothetical protein